MNAFLLDPDGTRIDYLGPPPEQGMLPAFFYFSLSGEESLTLAPYCQPALHLASSHLRIFSFNIPGHGPGMNKFHAIQYWADQMAAGNYVLEEFFESVVRAIRWLIEEGIVDPKHMAAGGLSRGAFMATHIAARIADITILLGFAPLTELMQLSEFSASHALKRQAEELNLVHLVEDLTHVRHVRFYIGNLDTRVGTDSCYHFIRRLAEKGREKHARHQKIELMIYQSVGQHGHGTEPHTFVEGSSWVKNHLIRASI